MTTPQAVLDKIAELEAEIQESATEMIRTSGVIADLRQVQESEEAVQATARNALDLLRFVVGEYEIQEQGIPIYDLGTPAPVYPRHRKFSAANA